MPIVRDPKSNATKQRFARSRATTYVNDMFVDSASSPNTAKILKGLEQYETSINSDTSLNQASQILLEGLGCAISNEPRNFTLSDDNTTTIENENIVDPSIATLKPEQLSMTDSFIDVNDPIYQLDDEIPEDIQQERGAIDLQDEPSYVSFVAEMRGVPSPNTAKKGTFQPGRIIRTTGTATTAPGSSGTSMTRSSQGGY
tara:strand:- start:181 stop:780 length:600 start_codon:yes stop_codon:yes gene_type:complete